MKTIATKERGATLVVALVMLLLFTLLISGAFTIGTVNLKAVGNMQWRDEALAAANAALERIIGSAFTAGNLKSEEHLVDINGSGNAVYKVDVAVPVCIRAVVSTAAPKCSVDMPICPSDTWDTTWDLRAVVEDPASGAQVVVRSGVRVLLSDTRKNAICPDA